MYIILFLFWVILNGKFNLEIAIFGLVISAALYWFICKFMNYSMEWEMHVLKAFWGIVSYVFFLAVEIIKANLAVVHVILQFDSEPEPMMAEFTTDLKTTTGRVLLANSITLTPGTITVELEDDSYLVHGLEPEYLEGIHESDFVRRIKKLEAQAEKEG